MAGHDHDIWLVSAPRLPGLRRQVRDLRRRPARRPRGTAATSGSTATRSEYYEPMGLTQFAPPRRPRSHPVTDVGPSGADGALGRPGRAGDRRRPAAVGRRPARRARRPRPRPPGRRPGPPERGDGRPGPPGPARLGRRLVRGDRPRRLRTARPPVAAVLPALPARRAGPGLPARASPPGRRPGRRGQRVRARRHRPPADPGRPRVRRRSAGPTGRSGCSRWPHRPSCSSWATPRACCSSSPSAASWPSGGGAAGAGPGGRGRRPGVALGGRPRRGGRPDPAARRPAGRAGGDRGRPPVAGDRGGGAGAGRRGRRWPRWPEPDLPGLVGRRLRRRPAPAAGPDPGRPPRWPVGPLPDARPRRTGASSTTTSAPPCTCRGWSWWSPWSSSAGGGCPPSYGVVRHRRPRRRPHRDQPRLVRAVRPGRVPPGRGGRVAHRRAAGRAVRPGARGRRPGRLRLLPSSTSRCREPARSSRPPDQYAVPGPPERREMSTPAEAQDRMGQAPVVIIGRRTGRADRRLRAGQSRSAPGRRRGRRRGRRHQPDRRARRLAVRHRRPPLLHQGPGRSRTLWHEILPDEDFLLRPRMSRIFYKGKYYDYPLKAGERPEEPGPEGGLPLRALVPVGPDPTAQGPDQLRGLAGRPVRLAPLPHLLQDLHREGLGRAGQRDAGRLGRPAGEEPRPRQGRAQRPDAQAQPEGHHQPHRGVPVPQVRAGDDVGALPGPGREGRRNGPHGDQGRRPSTSTDGRATAVTLAARRRLDPARGRPRTSSRRCR